METMKNLTLKNIARVCEGAYHGDPALLERQITAVTTDSRKISSGCLFVAISGARADGHDFIDSAFAQGALCCLSEKELPGEKRPYIRISSSLEALKSLAEFYRQGLDIRVVGITGSVGKTSTKEMIASILSQKYRVLKTEGNFNNALGLPLTIFRLREEHQIAVLEMGISEFGEMTVLSKIARPDLVVMTNIGQCHLETLGSRDGILKAKSEIFSWSNPHGELFLNGDDDKLSSIRKVGEMVPHYFGLDNRLEAYADQAESLGLSGTRCVLHLDGTAIPVTISIPGKHMLYNALAGALVGRSLGLSPEEIRAGVEALQPVSGRNHILHCGNLTVIDDCYNANPVSMKASIDVLSGAGGRKVCILGDMLELGKEERQLHYEVGRYLASRDIDLLLTAGPLAKELAKGASEKKDLQIFSFDSTGQLAEKMPALLQAGDTVLIKASHGMGFQALVAQLSK